jgi:hypothetical protein
MRRRLFTLVSALSAVCCAASAVAWVWAAVRPGDVCFVRDGAVWNVGLLRGHAWATSVRGWPEPALPPGERVSFAPEAGYTSWGSIGWVWGDTGRARASTADGGLRVTGPFTNVGVQLWFPTALSAVLPAAWIGLRLRAARRRRQRTRAGLCRRCGYDLRGNVSGVCPECGARAGAAGRSGGREGRR